MTSCLWMGNYLPLPTNEEPLEPPEEEERIRIKKLFYECYPILCQGIYQIIRDKNKVEVLAEASFIKLLRLSQKKRKQKFSTTEIFHFGLSEAIQDRWKLKTQRRNQISY